MKIELDQQKHILKIGNVIYTIKKGFLTGKYRVYNDIFHTPVFECKNLEELEIWYNETLKDRKMELLSEIELINSQFSSEEIIK